MINHQHMVIRLSRLGVIVIIILSQGCPSAPTEAPPRVTTGSASDIILTDVGNEKNGLDLQVAFARAPDEAAVEEYRIMVVRESAQSSFGLSAAQALDAGGFTSVAKTGSNLTQVLSAQSQDSEGNLITNEVSYVAFVLTIADGEIANVDSLSAPSAPLALSSISSVVGNISVADVGNQMNGLDLQVSFEKAGDETRVSEYRIIVVKRNQATSFDIADALLLTPDRYTSVAVTGSDITTVLTADAADSDGDLIANDVHYSVFVQSVADGLLASDDVLSAQAPALVISSTNRPARNVIVDDAQNNGNASDMRIMFDAAINESAIGEYRIMAVIATAAAAFDPAAASLVPAANYQAIAPGGGPVDTTLEATFLDVEGGAIVTDVYYNIFVYSTPDGTVATIGSLAESSGSITLAVTNLVITLTTDIRIGSGGLDVDAAGDIYAADFGTSLSGGTAGTKIVKISPNGSFSSWATGFVGASGNDFDSAGNLFQSNIGIGTISKVTPVGAVSTFVPRNNGLRSPVGIVVDPVDTLYVCNCGDNTIQKVSPEGAVSTFADNSSGLLACPNGITQDDDGNFYVANFGNGRVVKILPDGSEALFATIPGNNNGHILYANGVLYVVARFANQIYTLTLDGERTLLAGSGRRGLRDGSALNATLSLTNDVAISPDGKYLYFNDVAIVTTNTNILAPIRVRAVVLDAP